jgi:hypothetical protein
VATRARCFRCGSLRDSEIHATSSDHPFIRRASHSFEPHPLEALSQRGGALVSSASCDVMEIADARNRGDFFVDKDGLGYVLRSKAWLDRVHARDGYLQTAITPASGK